jgi:hypothetical protein
MRKPFPIISGDADFPSGGESSFGNLEPLSDGTLVDAKQTSTAVLVQHKSTGEFE